MAVIQRAQIEIAKQKIRALAVEDRVEAIRNFIRNDARGNRRDIGQRLAVNVRQAS